MRKNIIGKYTPGMRSLGDGSIKHNVVIHSKMYVHNKKGI